MKSSARTRKRLRRTFVLAILILLTIVFSFQGLLTRLIAPISIPLVQFGTWLSEQVYWRQTLVNLTQEELQDLYEDREALAQLAQQAQQLKEENVQLRSELGFVERTHLQYMPAQILAKSISQSISRFVIDIGTMEGVQLGSPVVTGEGIYLGKVIEVGERSATVRSVTDPSHAIAVSLLNESRTIGVANGTVNGLLRIDFIPHDEIVIENDLVVTSGLESGIPSGLLIGIVNAVTTQTGSPFQQAVVEPLADVRRLSSVLLLAPTESP